jgi:hypothetical protein
MTPKSSGYDEEDEDEDVDELPNFLGALSPYTGFAAVSISALQ